MREEIRNTHIRVRDSFVRLHNAVPNRSLKDFPVADLRERILPLDEECRKTCNAVLEDSIAAASMKDLLPNGQLQQAGRTLTMTGKLIRDDMELSCPEIDWLIKRASEVPLCHGAGIIFNGDNTYAAVVIDETAMSRYLGKLDDYERIFGFKPRIKALEPQGCAKLE
jgi:galactokinase